MGGQQRVEKVKTLASSLASEPALLASVLAVLAHPRSDNLDRREPWWTPKAIAYLAGELPPGARAFEWGSGGSTMWMADRGARVTSVESEAAWAEVVAKAAPSAELKLVPGREQGQLRSEAGLRDGGQHYFDDYVASIDAFDDDSFDVVVIDGLCRVACAQRAAAKVKPGGLVVIDDIQRPELHDCLVPFSGWTQRRFRGFKRPHRLASGALTRFNEVAETAFLRRPGA